VTHQRSTPPGPGDVAEHPMLDFVPSASRFKAHLSSVIKLFMRDALSLRVKHGPVARHLAVARVRFVLSGGVGVCGGAGIKPVVSSEQTSYPEIRVLRDEKRPRWSRSSHTSLSHR
jgi:hypothetical protein